MEDAQQQAIDGFAERIFTQSLATFETLCIYIGDRLGLYRLLTERAWTSTALAEAAGMDPRYAREWLEQQTAAGIVKMSGDEFSLPAAHATVLADPDSLAYSSPIPRFAVAAAARMSDLVAAYRSGGGVSWSEFGDTARDAQGDQNRPWFLHALGDALASVPDLHTALSRPMARIADVACGHGWSTIALARAYPHAEVIGVDIDAPSIERARRHAGGTDRPRFAEGSATELERLVGDVDVAFMFEALHDLPQPVDVLTEMRRTVAASEGQVIIMDEAVSEALTGPADDLDRIMYGWSMLICLPDSMSTPGSAATGTVMRPATVERYARQAGFTDIEVLPIEGFSAFRFYRLRG